MPSTLQATTATLPLHTIEINSVARLKLINNGDIIDKAFSIGGKGKYVYYSREPAGCMMYKELMLKRM